MEDVWVGGGEGWGKDVFWRAAWRAAESRRALRRVRTKWRSAAPSAKMMHATASDACVSMFHPLNRKFLMLGANVKYIAIIVLSWVGVGGRVRVGVVGEMSVGSTVPITIKIKIKRRRRWGGRMRGWMRVGGVRMGRSEGGRGGVG